MGRVVVVEGVVVGVVCNTATSVYVFTTVC